MTGESGEWKHFTTQYSKESGVNKCILRKIHSESWFREYGTDAVIFYDVRNSLSPWRRLFIFKSSLLLIYWENFSLFFYECHRLNSCSQDSYCLAYSWSHCICSALWHLISVKTNFDTRKTWVLSFWLNKCPVLEYEADGKRFCRMSWIHVCNDKLLQGFNFQKWNH